MNNEPVAWIFEPHLESAMKMPHLCRVTPTKEREDYVPLYTHPAEPKELTVPKNSQDWKGMDGATAFWLVERHSNHWDDARLMMEEWLKANTHPVKELNAGGEPVKNSTYWKRQYNEMSALNDRLKSSLYHANEQIKYLEFHPAKTLTDADCQKLEELMGEYWDISYRETRKGISLSATANDCLNRFRAILRKAQEK